MEKYLGIDMAISNQDFNVKPSGDISAVSGRSCLAQDLLHALTTPKGSLLWHPDYGMDVYKFLKMPGTPINKLQLRQEIKQTVEADPRVEIGSTQVMIAEWDMNKICCKVSTQPISEGHRLNLVLGYGMYDISGEVVTDELA